MIPPTDPVGSDALFLNPDQMLNGLAYCEIVFADGRPVDWIYRYTNPAFHAQTGLGPVVGKRATEAIPGIVETDTRLLEIYGRVATTGVAERFEVFVASLKGWYRVQAYSPKYGYFIAIFDEVTVSKRHERELQSAQERLSLAQRASRSGLWDWDIAAGTLYWSDEFMVLFGLDATSTLSTFDGWRRAVHPRARRHNLR